MIKIRCARIGAWILFVAIACVGNRTAAEAPTKPIPPHLAEEFRIKREEVFAFAKKPVVTREGDKVTIAFATKGFCDVTVAIENREGRILRHLASGVLGPKAPPPFQRDSKEQTIVWDSKDDKGEYVDDRANTVVRVSLGLRARFERQHLWSPYLRHIAGTPGVVWPPSFAAQPEGVYVFDGVMTDFLYQFDHQGGYVRTVYPFPSDKLDKLVGVRRRVFEQSGQVLPWKSGFMLSSLLTGGANTRAPTGDSQVRSGGNSAMAIRNGQIALAYYSLNTLATDGTTGGRPLEGPATQPSKQDIFPRSVALSPDGNTAYVTGFFSVRGIGAAVGTHWLHGVGRVDVARGRKGDPLQTFAGVLSSDRKHGGSNPGQFKTPSSVDCDPQGRVYVTDHFNDRVQIFDPDGKPLKSIPINRPAEIRIDPRNGDLWVFSWALDCRAFRPGGSDGYGKGSRVQPKLTHLAPYGNEKVIGEFSFPIVDGTLGGGRHGGTQYRAIVNHWAPGDTGPEVWIISGAHPKFGWASAVGGQIRILRRKKGENRLEVFKDFTELARRELPHLKHLYRANIVVNPATGELYIPGAGLALDPESGKTRSANFPQMVRELAFDQDNHAYISTGTVVSRFKVSPGGKWREVPFDYGEEIAGRLSALPTGGGPFHTGGITVSPKGHVVSAVIASGVKDSSLESEEAADMAGYKPWKPLVYEGRGGKGLVRIWDRYGKIFSADAIQGIGYMYNVFMDKDDALYVASGMRRRGYPDANTGTLVKVKPGARILTTASVLPLKNPPARPPDGDLGGIGPKIWWEDAEWFFGGHGYEGKNRGGVAACHCAQYRVTQDYFARTFVPESLHYTVAVLDSEGNVVMRIGQYGNIDEGVPLVPDPRIPKPRSLGGDEVALFHPAYLAVDTDRRLFVNDSGNDRIVSVKLDYHASASVPLKDVPDTTASLKP